MAFAEIRKLGASIHDPYHDSHRQKAMPYWKVERVDDEDEDTGEEFSHISRTAVQQAGRIKPTSIPLDGMCLCSPPAAFVTGPEPPSPVILQLVPRRYDRTDCICQH